MTEELNKQFPIQSKNCLFQNEANCKTFVVKMSQFPAWFGINGFALSLALKQRLEATGKWSIHTNPETQMQRDLNSGLPSSKYSKESTNEREFHQFYFVCFPKWFLYIKYVFLRLVYSASSGSRNTMLW